MKFGFFIYALICFVNANPLSEQSGAPENALNIGTRKNFAPWNNGQYPHSPQIPQLPHMPQIPQIPQIPQMLQIPQFQWPQFPLEWPLPQTQWLQIPTPGPPLFPGAIETMTPVPGGVVNGMSQTMTSHTENVGGKLVTQTQGETLWNQNGHLQKETFGWNQKY